MIDSNVQNLQSESYHPTFSTDRLIEIPTKSGRQFDVQGPESMTLWPSKSF